MIQRSPNLPVAEVIIQCEVPASQHVSFHVHLFPFRCILSSGSREQGMPVRFQAVGHVNGLFRFPVGQFLVLVASELCGHIQAEFKFQGQLLLVSQAEHQRLAVIHHLLDESFVGSSEILLPVTVCKHSVSQMPFESQPVPCARYGQIVFDFPSDLRNRPHVRSFRHPSAGQFTVLFQRESHSFLTSYAECQHFP